MFGMSAAAAAAAAPAAAAQPVDPAHAKALQELLARTTPLSNADFEQYAPIVRVCQNAGACPYEWPAVRHLLALRLQGVFSDFLASDATHPSDPMAVMCFECRLLAAARAEIDGSAAVESVANKCRHSAVDEESLEVRFQRVLFALNDFYKPPFTFQRICDLLLEPRLYSKNVNKFLGAFSKLVLGISSEVIEDNFNVNWLEQKDQTLGIPAMQFTTREEDEFAAAGMGGSVATVATHALLPPQHHRPGMSAEEIASAKEQEAALKQALDQRQPVVHEEREAPQEGAAAAGAASDEHEQQQQEQQEGSGNAPMDSSE